MGGEKTYSNKKDVPFGMAVTGLGVALCIIDLYTNFLPNEFEDLAKNNLLLSTGIGLITGGLVGLSAAGYSPYKITKNSLKLIKELICLPYQEVQRYKKIKRVKNIRRIRESKLELITA